MGKPKKWIGDPDSNSIFVSEQRIVTDVVKIRLIDVLQYLDIQ